MKEKLFIQNRKSQKISVLVEKNDNKKGLVFVMHGLGGFKEQDQIRVFAEAFFEEGFTVVRFDTTNTFGESEGNYEDATVTNYFEDLEDVIGWTKKQDWYEEPFWLIGHSLGGLSTALYAQKFPDRVKALAPISSVISGKLSLENKKKNFPEKLEEFERTGWRTNQSKSIPGLTKRLKWFPFKEDILKYDLLENSHKLTMPVLLIVGDKDESTPPEHQRTLFEKLTGEKELHLIKDALHTFKEEDHLAEIKQIIKNWIKKIN